MAQRTWFITGISTGFGRLMAEKLLARGDKVAGTVRKPDVVAALKEQYGAHLWVGVLDLANTETIRPVVDAAFAAMGRIDVVVSNAGYGLMGAAEEMTDAQIAHQIQTNLVGSIQVVRACLPYLRAQGSGRFLQLSSVGGQVAFPGGSMYHATKWGIEGFMEAVAQEVAVFGIGVTIVEPGAARTEFRYGSAQLAPRIAAYDASPASNIRRILTEKTSLSIGDPAKMVDIMIASLETTPAPRRLVLGSDAWKAMQAALTARLADVQGQKDVAESTDGKW